MAYLKSFEHDVFISYCHDDNEVAEGKGWVESFAEQLKISLNQESGQRGRIDVWRDPELSRAQVFDEVIERAVRRSGVMLVFLSRAYQNSDYCRQERAWFRDQAAELPIGMEVGAYRRVIPYLLRDVPPEERPEACQGTLGFTFHHTEGDEAGWPLDPDSKVFRSSLRGLVGALWTILQEIQGQDAAGIAAGAEVEADIETGDGTPFCVFMAYPPVDLRPTREQLHAALAGKDIELLGDVPPPDDEAGHAEAVKQAVARADLSVHLLGLEPGKALPGGAGSYPVAQAEIGLAHARSQLFLMREEFDVSYVEDEAYAGFLHSLAGRERDVDRLEVVRTGRHQMLGEILGKRRKLIDAARRAKAAPGVRAFIDLHSKDWSRAGDLMAYLEQRRVPCRLEPSAEPERFARALQSAGLFLVIFGEVARDWVLGRIKRAVELSIDEDLQVLLAVYVASSSREQKGFGRNVEIVEDVAGLEKLLEKAAAQS